MASQIAIVYGADSKLMRRVYVCDTDEDLARAVVTVPGEAVHYMLADEYATHDAVTFRTALAEQVGVPKNDGRVAEVDATGKCVAVYSADPLIDKPVLGEFHTLELSKFAEVNDVKIAGKFEQKVAEAKEPRLSGID